MDVSVGTVVFHFTNPDLIRDDDNDDTVLVAEVRCLIGDSVFNLLGDSFPSFQGLS